MEAKNNIYKALTAIMSEVEAIGKNKKNQQQGFMYRGIDDLYNDLQPKFSKHKVFITSEVLECTREERVSQKGGMLLWTILKVRFTFFAEDGSSVSSIMVGEAMDSGDKGANKAMSVALKYCLMQLLLIPTEESKKEDPDGHISEPAAKQEEEDKRPWMNESMTAFKKACDGLRKGETSIEKIEAVYKLSAEIKDKLLGCNNSVHLKKA